MLWQAIKAVLERGTHAVLLVDQWKSRRNGKGIHESHQQAQMVHTWIELCMVNDDIIIVYAIEHAICTQVDMARSVLNKTKKNSKKGSSIRDRL